MTAEVLLVCLSVAAAVLAAGLSAVVLTAFGPAGWLVIAALALAFALAGRLLFARLGATASWLREDLRDDWRAG